MRIGDWVLRDAAAQARALARPAAARARRRSWMNLSARQLTQPGFPDRVAQVLRGARAARRARSGFEVRESVLTDVERTHGAGGVLGGLAAIGCRIAIDDFGTAYSSLRALGRYHVDTIKIDRALVRGLPAQPDRRRARRARDLARSAARPRGVRRRASRPRQQLRRARPRPGCTTAARATCSPRPAPASRRDLLGSPPTRAR